MEHKKNVDDNSILSADESYQLKPAFRIFSRSYSTTGWAAFFESRPKVVYPKRAVIVSQDEENPNIFYIVRGLVEYTNAGEDGSENILEILGPGNMLNLQPVFGHNPSIATFAALSECVLASADKSKIWQLMRQSEEMTSELLEEMAFIIGGLNRRFAMGVERSDIRTLRIIQMIATIHRDVYKEKEPINIRLSQSDLARIVQTTRVTISKILSELKRKGIIETNYGGISVINIELLAKIIKTGLAKYSE